MESMFDEVIDVSQNARLWMTNVTMQGDGSRNLTCRECGLEVAYSGAVYAEGVSFKLSFEPLNQIDILRV